MEDRKSPTKTRVIVLIQRCLFLGFTAFPVLGAFGAEWHHVQAGPFVLSYTPATEPFVQDAARIALETKAALTEYFGDDDPRTISIVLADESDQPNGGASVLDPLVFIDCRKTQSLFRGETDWLRTVLTHELSHQYSLRLLKNLPLVRPIDAISISFSNFSFFLQTAKGPLELPLWFIEGMAQMGSRKTSADDHDATRRMILRDAFLTQRLLSLEEMGRFEGTSRDYELVYNQGFSFLLFLEERYPQSGLDDLCRSVKAAGFLPAFRITYGPTLPELYEEWKASLAEKFPPKPSPASARLFDRKGPMVIETASSGDGRFVIANWDNDYTRFGLFHQGPGGFTVLSRDTGLTLKSESADGGVWFTKLVFDALAGSSTYEIFHARPDGRVRQITEHSRVLAFDVKDGHLAYARYKGAETELLIRRPDGTQKVLGTVPRGAAVYSLSLLNHETVLASLGTGTRVQGALLSQGVWTLLWPEAAITDLIAADEDRVVFSSTLDGTPQLYWADLVRNPLIWFRLTEASGGARFPGWTDQNSILTYSEYFEGGWHRSRFEGGLDESRPVTPPTPVLAPWKPVLSSLPDAETKKTPWNLVFRPEAVSLGLVTQSTSSKTLVLGALARWGATLFSAPGDWDLSAQVSIQQGFPVATPSQPQITLQTMGQFELGPIHNAVSFGQQAESTYYGKYGYEFLTYLHRNASLRSWVQTASDQTLAASLETSWSDHTTLTPATTFFHVSTGTLRWDWSDSPVSLFDPADLGQSGFGIFAQGRLFVPTTLDSLYWDPEILLLETNPVPQLTAGIGFRGLFLDSRVAATAALEGLATLSAVSGSRAFAWALPNLGGASWFSGYPADYTSVVHMVSGLVSLKSNPLVNTSDKTDWFERLKLGAGIRAGTGLHFDSWGSDRGLRPALPVSAEISLSGAFYQAPDHQSYLELKVAMALHDFAVGDGAPALKIPFQVYGQYLY